MAEYVIDLTGVKVKTIKEAHGIEAIEALCGLPVRERIVRCRDCKHAFDEGSGYLYCGRRPGHCFEARADGFCAWGKRKEVDA